MQQETIKQPSEADNLYEKFISLKDSLNGSNDAERFDSFVKAQFTPGEEDFKKGVLDQVREKVQYYQDLEEVKKLSRDNEQKLDLAYEFCRTHDEFSDDPKAFLENKFGHYSPKIKEGYFYKDFIEQASAKCSALLENGGGRESGVELIG